MRRFMNGEPSLRLHRGQSTRIRPGKINLLVEQQFRGLVACLYSSANPGHARSICIGTLKKSTIPTNRVIPTILGGSVKVWFNKKSMSGSWIHGFLWRGYLRWRIQ